MDIILHLGVHRSATTTLQQYLLGNAQAFRQAGLACWTPSLTRSGLFAGLIQNPATTTPLIDDRAARSAGRVRLEIERLERAAMCQLPISDENIIGASRNNLRDVALYPDLAARLARFLPALGAAPRRVGLGLRSYDSYWASVLAFAIRRGGPAPDDDLLRRLADQPRGWRMVLTEIAAQCPDAEIVVWPFEALADDPAGQVDVMTGGIRLGGGGLRRIERHNASPDAGALRRILELRGQEGGVAAQMPDTRRWMPFDAAQRARMRARYLEDLDWLASGADARIRFCGTEHDTAGQRRVDHARLLDRASEVSGFAAPAPTWTPLNGGRHIGNDRRLARTRREGASGSLA